MEFLAIAAVVILGVIHSGKSELPPLDSGERQFCQSLCVDGRLLARIAKIITIGIHYTYQLIESVGFPLRVGKTEHRNNAPSYLGCIVSWNSLEKTRDCPCHGSRYDRYGGVINGPANSDLAPVEEE